MTIVAFAMSLCVAALGALGVASPARLLATVRRFQGPAGLYVAMVVRLVLGVALFLIAPSSRAPEFLRILGIVLVVAGLLTLLIGVERFSRLLDWWSARGLAFTRVWSIFAFGFGLLLAYTLLPNNDVSEH